MSNTAAPHRQRTPLEPFVRKIARAKTLDPAGKVVGRTVRKALPGGPLKDALSGTWIGHAMHPMLTDVVIGSFTSASLLDVLAPGDDGKASDRLIAVGIAAYLPTAASGINDWADSEAADDAVRRAGLVHAGCNALGASLYGASWAARRRGDRRKGALLGLAGLTALMAGGYLGWVSVVQQGCGTGSDSFRPRPRGLDAGHGRFAATRGPADSLGRG